MLVLSSLVASALALTAVPFGASAADTPPASTISLSDWSSRVWTNAGSGDGEGLFGALRALPSEHEDGSVRSLRAAVDRLDEHESAARAKRLERLAEVEQELNKHIAADDLSQALVSAVELTELSTDKQSTLNDARIRALVSEAERKFREAEGKSDWFLAQDLVYRLNILFEQPGTYRDDLRRLSERMALLRLYAPKKLHEIRNEYRKRDGKEPLPFNDMGEKWQDKLAGIDQFMVRRALLRAHHSHVDGAALKDLIEGGLLMVRTLVTTPDLSVSFAGLSDRAAREKMVQAIDARLASTRSSPRDADTLDLSRVITALLEANTQTIKIPEQALLRAFGDGAISKLDEFSEIYWPDMVPQFLRTTQGKFQGVGVQIRVDEGGNLMVVTPLDDTPAARAGMRRGDIIRKVDGDPTLGITVLQAVDKITGAAGTPVTLTIERPGREEWFDLRLTRAEIPIYSVKGWSRSGVHEDDWDWFVDRENKIGYVRLTQFSEDTTRQFDRALNQMRTEGLNALILDLRYNPGGLLTQAVSISNRFVNSGVIVSQHDATGVQTDAESARPGMASLRNIPVAILINEGSASASEIVAGAVQDYARLGEVDAILVGSRSYGKGSVQNLHDLARGSAILKLTERYYHLPDGRLIHRKVGAEEWGVHPDVEVQMLPSQMSDAIELRDAADILPGQMDADGDAPPDPRRLLTEGIDPQLETAVLLLQARVLGRTSGHAMLTTQEPAPAAAVPAGGG
ncbi:MAG: S41 family peptidase [Phycisphaerales bacterium]|nr:S41 family peptidase [Phycisphaerales bacterium]